MYFDSSLSQLVRLRLALVDATTISTTFTTTWTSRRHHTQTMAWVTLHKQQQPPSPSPPPQRRLQAPHLPLPLIRWNQNRWHSKLSSSKSLSLYSSTSNSCNNDRTTNNDKNRNKNRNIVNSNNKSGNDKKNVGGYDPSEGINVSDRAKERSNVGNPQQTPTMEKEFSVTSILKELAAIQQQGPQKYCILGTRHCSYLHQQIIELLYVPVFSFRSLFSCCFVFVLYLIWERVFVLTTQPSTDSNFFLSDIHDNFSCEYCRQYCSDLVRMR
jgi:hypothetical protein